MANNGKQLAPERQSCNCAARPAPDGLAAQPGSAAPGLQGAHVRPSSPAGAGQLETGRPTTRSAPASPFVVALLHLVRVQQGPALGAIRLAHLQAARAGNAWKPRGRGQTKRRFQHHGVRPELVRTRPRLAAPVTSRVCLERPCVASPGQVPAVRPHLRASVAALALPRLRAIAAAAIVRVRCGVTAVAGQRVCRGPNVVLGACTGRQPTAGPRARRAVSRAAAR